MLKNTGDRPAWVTHIMFFLLFILIGFLIIESFGFKRDSPKTSNITYITSVEASIQGGEFKQVTLPYTFQKLPSHSKIRLKAEILPDTYDGLYIKTPNVRANVFLNQRHVFEFGKRENYPKFMVNPAREIHIVEPYGKCEPMDLSIEFITSNTPTPLYIEPFMVGTTKEIFLELSQKFATSMVFAFAEIIGGFALCLLSLGLVLLHKNTILYFWLGLFAIFTGSWFFGTNDFALTVFPHSTLLYLSAYIGFMSFSPCLIQFLLTGADFRHKKALQALEILTLSITIVFLFLQLNGTWALHQSRLAFQLYIVIILLLIVLFIILETIKYKTPLAKDLIMPLILLFISTAIDIFIKIFTDKVMYFPPAQIGSLLFLMIMAFYTGRNIKVNLEFQRQAKELALKEKLLNLQTEEQRKSKLLMAENEKIIRHQRHDLHHHLIAIKELAGGSNVKLDHYLDSLIESIPKSKINFCENTLVNAIISHYNTICMEKSIEFSSSLIVPETKDSSLDSNLCVIFANLLENATEACLRMDNVSCFINIKSKIHNNMLVVSMENTYNGYSKITGDTFYSSKRDEEGVGLSSITAIAEKYHGSANFIPKDQKFISHVYLKIK